MTAIRICIALALLALLSSTAANACSPAPRCWMEEYRHDKKAAQDYLKGICRQDAKRTKEEITKILSGDAETTLEEIEAYFQACKKLGVELKPAAKLKP
jgi:hypothetical protein